MLGFIQQDIWFGHRENEQNIWIIMDHHISWFGCQTSWDFIPKNDFIFLCDRHDFSRGWWMFLQIVTGSGKIAAQNAGYKRLVMVILLLKCHDGRWDEMGLELLGRKQCPIYAVAFSRAILPAYTFIELLSSSISRSCHNFRTKKRIQICAALAFVSRGTWRYKEQ